MQKIISEKIHGLIDYLMVTVFALAPILLDFSFEAAVLSYVLATVHFLMTVATHFKYGVVDALPFGLHGMAEALIGVVLLLGGILYFSSASQLFFAVTGGVILLVWFLTRYTAPASLDEPHNTTTNETDVPPPESGINVPQ